MYSSRKGSEYLSGPGDSPLLRENDELHLEDDSFCQDSELLHWVNTTPATELWWRHSVLELASTGSQEPAVTNPSNPTCSDITLIL
jgi:hypothetical protein